MANDMYAAVDVTKKKKNHRKPPKPVPLDATYSMVTASECPPTYAAVDKSKKRKGKNMPKERETGLSDTTMASYDVVKRDVGNRQENDIPETIDTNYSTLDLNNTENSTATNDSLSPPAQTAGKFTKRHNIIGSLKNESGSWNKLIVCAIAVAIIALAVAVVIFICLIVLFAKTADLNREINSLQSASSMHLMEHHENISYQTMIFEKLEMVENRTATLDEMVQILHGCSALSPSHPSGYYSVRAPNGSVISVYCNMEELCNITGVWTRVAYLNMMADHQCPGTLMHNDTSMACVVNNDEKNCSSVTYSTFLPYSKICGKILAHATGNPDGFATFRRSGRLTLDSNYVDGVSLTHGEPRQQIWTFAAYCIPCDLRRPLFINDAHYFCAERSSNPVWDGINDCHPNNPPWFHRELSALTTDNIEMRVCRDEGRDNEDIGITHIELYVQ